MKANKVIVNITVETLSTDSVYAIIMQMAKQFDEAEVRSGKLSMEDGDNIEWFTEQKEVNF